jgi:hypothetical protein
MKQPFIEKFKEYNTWTIWTIPNNNLYHKRIISFIKNKIKLEMKSGGRFGKKSKKNNLIEFVKKVDGAKKPKCQILMTGNPNKKEYIFLNLIVKNKELEEKLSKFIKKIVKNDNVEMYKKHYYQIELLSENNKYFEINKRSMSNIAGTDYDAMQYRAIKIPGSKGGMILVFKHKIRFLAYPDKESFIKDSKEIIKRIKDNLINY